MHALNDGAGDLRPHGRGARALRAAPLAAQRARPLLRGHPPRDARAERQLPPDVHARRADQRGLSPLSPLGLRRTRTTAVALGGALLLAGAAGALLAGHDGRPEDEHSLPEPIGATRVSESDPIEERKAEMSTRYLTNLLLAV